MSELKNSYPLRRAHYVGTSVVVTINPSHIKRLNIDDYTYFEQVQKENGIILEKRRFS